MHWRRKWKPTPVFLPGKSQGWWSLVGCHPWACTESDMTEATWQQSILGSCQEYCQCYVDKLLSFQEESMATYSSILAWRISWTEEPGGLQSIGWQTVRSNLARMHAIFLKYFFQNYFPTIICHSYMQFQLLDLAIIWSHLFSLRMCSHGVSTHHQLRLGSSFSSLFKHKNYSPSLLTFPPKSHIRAQCSEHWFWSQTYIVQNHVLPITSCTTLRWLNNVIIS